MMDLFKPQPQIVYLKELCENKIKFYIPSYQRGYRWGQPQIEYLLKDILSYDRVNDGDFYCLQPIVVHYSRENNWWRLVDGQQRLTTLYLIIKILKPESSLFSIEFERGSHFPKLYDEEIQLLDDSAENFYLTQACQIIHDWKSRHSNEDITSLLATILDTSNLGIIWYPIAEESDTRQEFDFFMHLNSGKINLTDAELVKALLLHDTNRGVNIEKTLSQMAIAEEWNRMETILRKPSFWYFIAGRTPMPDCAMDYLLDLHYRSLIKEDTAYANYPYPAFAWAEDAINEGGDAIWNDLRKTFAIIVGWYEDTEAYNLIGYLTTVNNHSKNKLVSLLKLMRSNGITKHGFIAMLWNDITIKSKVIPDTDITKIQQGKDYDDLDIYNYKFNKPAEKTKIFQLLTLINVALCTIGGLKRRFEFEKYNDIKTPWNIEHISPQNPKDDTKLLTYIRDAENIAGNLPTELSELKGLLEEIATKRKENPDSSIESLLSNDNYRKYQNLLNQVLPFDENDVMSLGNLTLLTENPNKSIGNNFFFVKRCMLKNKQEDGHFIPQATLNVFTKWYSKSPDSPLLWQESDRKDYKLAIAQLLHKTFKYIKDNYPYELTEPLR
jgi:hypothetical protein